MSPKQNLNAPLAPDPPDFFDHKMQLLDRNGDQRPTNIDMLGGAYGELNFTEQVMGLGRVATTSVTELDPSPPPKRGEGAVLVDSRYN